MMFNADIEKSVEDMNKIITNIRTAPIHFKFWTGIKIFLSNKA